MLYLDLKRPTDGVLLISPSVCRRISGFLTYPQFHGCFHLCLACCPLMMTTDDDDDDDDDDVYDDDDDDDDGADDDAN